MRLSTKHVYLKMPTGGTAKLMPKYIGPLKVMERLGSVAYRLALPSNLSMHPVFHVSLLSAYHTDGTCQPLLPAESNATGFWARTETPAWHALPAQKLFHASYDLRIK